MAARQSRAVLAALCCVCLAGSVAALPGLSRTLLQDIDQLTVDGPTPFQEVSACVAGSTQQLGSGTKTFTVNDITATLELDTDASYTQNFRLANRRTWSPGNSRLNVSLALALAGGATSYPQDLVARVNTVTCGSPVSDSTIYQQFPGQSNTTITADVPFTNADGTGSVTVPFLMDYDTAKSLVLYNQGSPVACCNMIPPFPDFPSEWTTTVEANMVDQGFTFVMQQYYSASSNAVRIDVHSSGTDTVLIQDFNQQSFVVITAGNATYPHGTCSARPFYNGGGRGGGRLAATVNDDNTTTVLETAEFLRFTTQDVPASFVPGVYNVRGIDCELWTQNYTSNYSQYSTEYYFPISQWLVAREDYHRLLKRVHQTGTRGNGNYSVERYFEYINFRPHNASDMANFVNVCSIAPQGYNCNCTAQQVAAATQGVRSDADGVVIDTTPVECLSTNHVPHGFTSAQGGPYAVLTVVGFIGGTLLATIATVLYYRKAVGVSAGDKLNHSRLQEFQLG